MAGRFKSLLLIVILSLVLLMTGCGKKEYTIIFDSDGGTEINERIIKKGDIIPAPSVPIKKGYKFIGWTLDGEAFDFATIVKENITLVAEWEAIDIESEQLEKFTIDFDTKGGSKVISQEVLENEQIIKPLDPTKKGYQFICWMNNNIKWDFADIVTKDITLIAQWEVIDDDLVKVQKNMKETEKETKKETEKESKDVKNKEDKGKEETKETKYTITFNTMGGNSLKGQTIIKGKKVIIPEEPIRDGYKFIGWLLNNNLYDFNNEVNSDFELVAKWEQLDVYTYTTEKFGEDGVSTLVKVYKNNQDITKDAYAVYDINNNYLGRFEEKYGVISVDNDDVSKIAKIKLNNEYIKIIKK